MLKRRLIAITCIGLMSMAAVAKAASPWEGRWEMRSYNQPMGGVLIIKNCNNSKCNFEIFSSRGAHTCQAEGEMKINNNDAKFYKRIREAGDNFDEEINFSLDPKKRIIDVKRISGYFCGMRADITGRYENEALPYRFPTSFDCWQEDLAPTETVICANSDLAKADVEFEANYKEAKTPEWEEKRNKCGDDKQCIRDFYKSEIIKAYEARHKKPFNLYEYTQSQTQEWYYPTDLAIMNDFFDKNMDKGYRGAWSVSLDDDSYTWDCDNCLMMSFGVAGLYKIYESAWYVDEDEVWIAFISANLQEPEDKNIIVFAPKGETLDNMPPTIKEFTDRLIASGFFAKDSVKLMEFKEFQKPKSWKDRILAIFKG